MGNLNNSLVLIGFSCLTILLGRNSLVAQEYFGLGLHFAPPIRIDNCCNAYVEVKPIIVPAYSFTFRKMWENKNEKEWFYELGITTMGLGVNMESYLNDTQSVWIEYNMTHTGFPSLLFGGGRVFSFRGKSLGHDLSLGLEGSFRIAHELKGLRAKNFGLTRLNADITFPVFLRLNAGYGFHFKFLRNIPFYVQIYGNVSVQDIARGPQYLRDPSTGIINEEGKYKLNNSEVGLKLFANTDINYNKHKWVKKEKLPKEKRNQPLAYRISVEGQTYKPPATKYYIPKIDSFSLTGLPITFTQQAGIKTEFLHPGNTRWAAVLGVSFGITTISNHFKTTSSFTRLGWDINSTTGSPIGFHFIPNVGIAYNHSAGKKRIQHTVSSTLVVPLSKEDIINFIPDGMDPSLPPHLWPQILWAEINYKYGRSSTLFGVEYQPELLVHADERFFYGIGMVFNYTSGVIAQGRATVDNGRSQYYGGIIQNFSKIGVSLRLGWNSSPRN